MLFFKLPVEELVRMNKGMEIHTAWGKKWRLKNIARINEYKETQTAQWTITNDQTCDYNLEIHGISSTNSVLISYMFFKCHFKNSCHKHHTFNGSLLLSKLSSGLNMFCVHDPTQTGWTALPLNTSHIATSFCFSRTFCAFLEDLSSKEKSI